MMGKRIIDSDVSTLNDAVSLRTDIASRQVSGSQDTSGERSAIDDWRSQLEQTLFIVIYSCFWFIWTDFNRGDWTYTGACVT